VEGPRLLKPSRYIDAIKLRTNTIGTKVVLNRVFPIDIKCRRCGMQAETLGHILGMCLYTKPKGIRRSKRSHRGQTSERVLHLRRASGERGRRPQEARSSDQTPGESSTSRCATKIALADVFREKKRKYKATADHIVQRLGCATVEVLPIVVGCRGAMPGQTVENLSRLGMKIQDMLTVSMIALPSSIEIANAFLDYDYIV